VWLASKSRLFYFVGNSTIMPTIDNTMTVASITFRERALGHVNGGMGNGLR
jgi:hypothetical protein